MSTVDEVLRTRLRRDPGSPLVTFYDDASGERTELSATTYANWVAKTAGVLTEDLDVDEGDAVHLAAPLHWLGPVFLGALALVGAERAESDARVLVTGPGELPAGAYDEVLACSLHPFALPFASRLDPAPGSLDFGTLWPNQPDAYLGVPSRDPVPSSEPSADRVLTDLDPLSPVGTDLFWSTLLGGGSVVWVARPAPERWGGRATSERVDREVRAS